MCSVYPISHIQYYIFLIPISSFMYSNWVSIIRQCSCFDTYKDLGRSQVQLLVNLKPHDGQPVNATTFLTASHKPDRIILITMICSWSLFMLDSTIVLDNS